MAEYRRCFRRASVIRAACEDYRTGLTTDVAADRAAGPVLTLWGEPGGDGRADEVSSFGLACGHFLIEEAPAETTEALEWFFAADEGDSR